MSRYYARSASDNTDDWPYWFVADSMRGGLNVTAELVRELNLPSNPGAVLGMDEDMVKLAMRANSELHRQ